MKIKQGKAPSKLALVRFNRGWNQYDLANAAGVSQSRISLIENHYLKPTALERRKIAKALKIPARELFPKG